MLLLPDDPGFEAARVSRIFNRRRTDRQPAAVLRSSGRPPANCAQMVVWLGV